MWIYIDLDGTILDVYERYSGIFNLYAEKYGKHIEKNEYKKLRQEGFADYDIFKYKWNLEIDREEYRILKHRYLESPEWLEKDVIIGEPELIRNYNCNFAIITQRNNKKEAMNQIKNLKLDVLFDEIIVLKPYSGKNQKLEFLKNKVTQEDCIIGDSKVELECARKLGIQGYFVKTGLFGIQIVEKEKIEEDYLACIEHILHKV